MGSTLSTSRASWWPRRTARNKISLSMNLISVKKRPKMGLFLDSQENATCDKNPFKSRHHHLSTTNCWGQSQKKAPKKILCIKNVSEPEPRKQHQGHLNMRIDQEKISQCCNRK